MVKKVLIFTICFIWMIISPIRIYAEDDGAEISQNQIIEAQLKSLNIDQVEELIRDVNKQTGRYLPKIDFKSYILGLVKGENILSTEEILKGIFKTMFTEVISNFELVGQLLILAVISALLSNLHNAFERDAIGQLAHYVTFLIIISIVFKSFVLAMTIGREAIEQMVVFMQALLPMLITLLAAMGGITSSALFQPIILGSISAITTIIKDFLLPLIMITLIIGMISKISTKMQISKLSSLLRQIIVVVIGICSTIFMGIMSIHGATASKVDGVTIRTAKFAVDNFIPIIGGFLSDAMDTVVGCSMLLKNAVGVVGLILLFLISIMPAIKLTSLIFVYKLTIAAIEPIGDEKIVDCLSEVNKALVLILATVLAVGIMFFIGITIILGAGNMTMMLR